LPFPLADLSSPKNFFISIFYGTNFPSQSTGASATKVCHPVNYRKLQKARPF
jgi:hypothetical protein